MVAVGRNLRHAERLEADSDDVPPPRANSRVYGLWGWFPTRRTSARTAAEPAHARTTRAQPRRSRKPRGDAGSAGPRQLRAAPRPPVLFHDLLRRAGDRAARSPRGRRG